VAYPAEVATLSAAHVGQTGYAVSETTTKRRGRPADARCDGDSQVVDSEVLEFRARFEERSPLDSLVREGARKMLQHAIEAEVDAFLAEQSSRVDEKGNRLVIRNGFLREGAIVTGAGSLEVRQPRVRDNSPEKSDRVRFSLA
jgi:hypothetical protein